MSLFRDASEVKFLYWKQSNEKKYKFPTRDHEKWNHASLFQVSLTNLPLFLSEALLLKRSCCLESSTEGCWGRTSGPEYLRPCSHTLVRAAINLFITSPCFLRTARGSCASCRALWPLTCTCFTTAISEFKRVQQASVVRSSNWYFLLVLRILNKKYCTYFNVAIQYMYIDPDSDPDATSNSSFVHFLWLKYTVFSEVQPLKAFV